MIGRKRIFLAALMLLEAVVCAAERESICLNGDLWERSLQPSATVPGKGWEQARVPEGLGSRYDSDFGRKNTGNINAAWYRLNFKIPSDWKGNQILLNFARVHEKATLLINGRTVGEHSKWPEPWKVDISDFVNFGQENKLELKIESFKDRERDWKNTNVWFGVEGDVELLKIPSIHIEDIQINTSVRKKKLLTHVELLNRTNAVREMSVEQEVFLRGESIFKLPAKQVSVPAGGSSKVDFEKDWENPVLWGFAPYGTPELYYLQTTAKDASGTIDVQSERFGFQELWAQGNKFYFNGKELFIKGDGLNYALPATLYNRAYITAYLIASRDANVNTIRPHVGEMFPAPVLFDVADELGMMIIPQASVTEHNSGLGISNKDDVEWFSVALASYIKAHRNHPSIAMWGIDNENNMQKDTNPTIEIWKTLNLLSGIAKKTDPSRLLLHAGDLKLGLAPRYGIPSPLEIYSIHPYGDPIYNETMRLCMLYGYNGKIPIFLDEIYCGDQEPFNTKTTPEKYIQKRFAYFKSYDVLGDFWKRSIMDSRRKLKIAGAIPWTLSECIYYGPADETTTNLTPWVTSKGEATELIDGAIPVEYPALSGEGMKQPYYLTHRMFGRCFNFFDSTRAIYHKNATFDYVKTAFAEVDGQAPGPLASKRIAELVVAVFDENGKPLKGAIVRLNPKGNQRSGIRGVMTDSQGKAWFLVKEEGQYEVTVADSSIPAAITDVKFPDLNHEAGFNHVQWLVIGKGSVEDDINRLKAPAKVKRKLFTPPIVTIAPEEVKPGPFTPDSEGFIRNWLLCGPFPNLGDRQNGFTGYKTDYLVDQGGELKIRPKRGLTHQVFFPESKSWKTGTAHCSWRQFHSPKTFITLEGLISPEVELITAPPQCVVAYAACYVDSSEDIAATLAIGSDDGCKVWMNHKEVGDNPEHGAAIVDELLFPVQLKAGRNILLLKVDQSFNGWGFYCRFLDPKTKKPLTNLKIELE